MAKKIATRRSFLSGTAGAIATGAAVAMPQEEGLNKSISLEKMAHALHEAVGRYADRNAPTVGPSLRSGESGFMFSMECLRGCSVDEIQHLLKPLYGGA